MSKIDFTDGGASPTRDRDRRERLGLSVDDLAAAAEIDSAALVAYEQTNAGSEPDLVVGQKVREALTRLEAESETD